MYCILEMGKICFISKSWSQCVIGEYKRKRARLVHNAASFVSMFWTFLMAASFINAKTSQQFWKIVYHREINWHTVTRPDGLTIENKSMKYVAKCLFWLNTYQTTVNACLCLPTNVFGKHIKSVCIDVVIDVLICLFLVSVGSSSRSSTSSKRRNNKKPVPPSDKDDKYFERRNRNNLAAKRSRDSRKKREDQVSMRATFLEKENEILRAQLDTLRQEFNSLKHLLAHQRPINMQTQMPVQMMQSHQSHKNMLQQ